MMINEVPQTEVHTLTAPHPISPTDTVFANNWSGFPSKRRTHVSTMRARSAVVRKKFAWRDRRGEEGDVGCDRDRGERPSALSHPSSTAFLRPQSAFSASSSVGTGTSYVHNGIFYDDQSNAAPLQQQGRPASSRSMVFTSRAAQSPSARNQTNRYERYPASTPRRPASAAPNVSVSRMNSDQTAASRARSATGSRSGMQGHEVRGRADGTGGYSWLTLSLFADSNRAVYDPYGGLRGSKRTK